MTLSGVLHYNGTEETTNTTADITLATETTTSEIYIFPKEKAPKALKYRLAIKEFSFHKKMYQPTEALALISITKAQGVDNAYERIDWDMLDKMFKHAKVSLADGDFTIGDDYSTDIRSVQRKAAEDDAYYNLNGQRTEHPDKGIYIYKGKKVIK